MLMNSLKFATVTKQFATKQLFYFFQGMRILVLGLLVLVDSKSLRPGRSALRFPPPLGPFSRAAVEQAPALDYHGGSLADHSAALRVAVPEEFGSRRLPLRSAVESVPPK